jgi:hypothetical protein
MRYLIGIDDTDNLESRGTGYRARCMGAELAAANLARIDGVSRHQLLVHPDIPYTSHNSSLCLDARVPDGGYDEVVDFCREFLLRESAEGSDAGLCIAAFDAADAKVQDFGRRAKEIILDQAEAARVAGDAKIHLEGLTGDHGGVIGALAGVGLRVTGRDGRFVWLDGAREISGAMQAAELLQQTGIEEIRDREGRPVAPEAMIFIDSWARAVLIEGRAVLLVEQRGTDDAANDWQLLPREEIRRF